MARKRNTKKQPEIALLKMLGDTDLPLRIEKISEQTGLSSINLLQKWILQEESLIEVIRRSKEHTSKRATHASVSKSAEFVPPDPGSPDYRKMLAKRAKNLKKEGMTLKKIAETFNDEKMPTVSGSGKWYPSSITNLLNSKM